MIGHKTTIYNHIVKTTCIRTKQTTINTIQAVSLSSAWDQMTGKGWGFFIRHPRKDIWIRRSNCNKFQQTIQQI